MSATAAAPSARSRELSPLLRFLGRRLLGAVAALFVASLVIFAGTQLLPGDAASVVLGRNGSPATVKLLHKQLQLDRPAYQQYADWIRGSRTATSATRRSAWRRARRARRSGR